MNIRFRLIHRGKSVETGIGQTAMKVQKRLVKEGVTGIFAMNDLMAAGVYDYAVKHNLTIGKDLSVIGFDNREICAAFTPALSTMALPLRKWEPLRQII